MRPAVLEHRVGPVVQVVPAGPRGYNCPAKIQIRLLASGANPSGDAWTCPPPPLPGRKSFIFNGLQGGSVLQNIHNKMVTAKYKQTNNLDPRGSGFLTGARSFLIYIYKYSRLDLTKCKFDLVLFV